MSELKVIARHAGSVWAGQLAVMAFGVTDTLVAGRYSDTALAALSVGAAVYISVYVGLMAVLQALLPVWAELLGAKRFPEVGRSARQALYLCTLIAVIGLTALLFPGPLLRWTQVPIVLQGQVESYLNVLALAMVPALLFRLYNTLNQSLGKPLLVTALQVSALVLKIPLSIWLTLGGAGVAPMGAVGCAWATVAVNLSMMLIAVVMLRTQKLYQPYRLWQAMEAPDWPAIRALAKLGVPTGLAVMVEVTSFTLMALFIARQGTVASAAHQIASSVVAVLYMMPLSIGIATSARVSLWRGAGNPVQARQAMLNGFTLTVLTSFVFSAILFIARERLAGLYASNLQVAVVAAELMGWIALFHIADALQTVSGFVLRSYRITIAPLLIYAALLWGVGLGCAYLWAYMGMQVGTMTLLARPLPSTFWISSTIALVLAAGALMGLLAWVVQRADATR